MGVEPKEDVKEVLEHLDSIEKFIFKNFLFLSKKIKKN